MSAESPNRSRTGPTTVTPQQVTDPTILDSVAGFINDVVPTAYQIPCETEDQIQWAHFEKLQEDLVCNDGENIIPSALILILGHTTGIQIWAIPASGEATEILSWRHGNCRVLKIIPTPFKIGISSGTDLFSAVRPLIAICDSLTNFSTLTFRSLKTGVIDPVKQIQFKKPILNVLANRRSIVVSFNEKIAVFDAFTLENRTSITTCYSSPGIQPNPIALGSRWLAYAEKKLITSCRSNGGNEGEGVQSYTATVLHAAKSLGRGLRELTETVAGSLTGTSHYQSQKQSQNNVQSTSPQSGGLNDTTPQKGIVTILDIENKLLNPKENVISHETIIAHFIAHTEAIVCLEFDSSGLLLLTADKRGHDFHLFRIQSHPAGAHLAAIHHLYVLHRGDTTAKVQDMCFSPDSRWVTVSTLRGTTHVFPVTPYGGVISVRTHGTTHVVNKMSRYHRSAGLTSTDGRSSSPVSLYENPVNALYPYRNPRCPPFPQPTIVQALAQIRQPVYVQNTNQPNRQHSNLRQRTSSLSSDYDNITLRIVGCFAPARAWIDTSPREQMKQLKPIESLFVMSCNGTLVQYDLEPLPLSSIAKERICNDTAIELNVIAKAQWLLQRQTNGKDVTLPMCDEYLKFIIKSDFINKFNKKCDKINHNDDYWLSQVEIVTHLGPHRRLWMGPQFTFKTYTITNGAVVETRPIDVRRSKPINMPISKANAVLIESGSASSNEQLFFDAYHKPEESSGGTEGELQLKEDLADAMLESPGIKEGGHCVIVSMKPSVAKVVNPLGTVVTLQQLDEQLEIMDQQQKYKTNINEDDIVIHENTDEALFRPIVTSKAIFYSDIKSNSHNNDILVKSVQSNTHLPVKIINNRNKTKPTGTNNKTSCTTTETTSTATKQTVSATKTTTSAAATKTTGTTTKTSGTTTKKTTSLAGTIPNSTFVSTITNTKTPKVTSTVTGTSVINSTLDSDTVSCSTIVPTTNNKHITITNKQKPTNLLEMDNKIDIDDNLIKENKLEISHFSDNVDLNFNNDVDDDNDDDQTMPPLEFFNFLPKADLDFNNLNTNYIPTFFCNESKENDFKDAINTTDNKLLINKTEGSNSSEEEKYINTTLKKIRKPKVKLGTKIQNKQTNNEDENCEIDNKKTTSIVENNSEEINICEIFDEMNFIKSDEEKNPLSGGSTTESSDDSSRIPTSNIIKTVEHLQNNLPIKTATATTTTTKRKPKKKRK